MEKTPQFWFFVEIEQSIQSHPGIKHMELASAPDRCAVALRRLPDAKVSKRGSVAKQDFPALSGAQA
jgi:hypothetical protein